MWRRTRSRQWWGSLGKRTMNRKLFIFTSLSIHLFLVCDQCLLFAPRVSLETMLVLCRVFILNYLQQRILYCLSPQNVLIPIANWAIHHAVVTQSSAHSTVLPSCSVSPCLTLFCHCLYRPLRHWPRSHIYGSKLYSADLALTTNNTANFTDGQDNVHIQCGRLGITRRARWQAQHAVDTVCSWRSADGVMDTAGDGETQWQQRDRPRQRGR